MTEETRLSARIIDYDEWKGVQGDRYELVRFVVQKALNLGTEFVEANASWLGPAVANGSQSTMASVLGLPTVPDNVGFPCYTFRVKLGTCTAYGFKDFAKVAEASVYDLKYYVEWGSYQWGRTADAAKERQEAEEVEEAERKAAEKRFLDSQPASRRSE